MNRTFLPDDFLPAANLDVLRLRARLLATIRKTFDDAGYFEVETPILSSDIVVDAWLEPFVAEWLPLASDWEKPGTPRYLQTSPEFAMKRLLAAGATAIYQLGKVFRNGEFGTRHNPEFTMAEWYRVGNTHLDQMAFTEKLVRKVFEVASTLLHEQTIEVQSTVKTFENRNESKLAASAIASPSPEQDVPRLAQRDIAQRVLKHLPFERLSYDEAFVRYAGQSVLNSDMTSIRRIAGAHNLVTPPGLDPEDRDGWLNWLLAELIEPHLGVDQPTFLWNYPASQAALARVEPSHPGGTAVAQRFELYIDGIELCNGYHELTDPSVLRERIREQQRIRTAAGLRPLPTESRLLIAMEAGLPASSGNALGVDRLIMLALGKSTISEVIAFPFDRA